MMINLLLAAFASYRITHALVLEDGPFDLFVKIAKLFEGTVIGKMLGCFWCTGFWVSLAISSFYSGNPIHHPLLWGVSALAISGASGALYEATLTEEQGTPTIPPFNE